MEEVGEGGRRRGWVGAEMHERKPRVELTGVENTHTHTGHTPFATSARRERQGAKARWKGGKASYLVPYLL